MSTASLTPVERFVRLLNYLFQAVDSRRAGFPGGFIPTPLAFLICQRLVLLRQRFVRLAERIQAGWIYRRKPYAPRPASEKPRKPAAKPDPLTTRSGWMMRLLTPPDSGIAHQGLDVLLLTPEMADLLAAAPGPAWRILRPLCWMLGVKRPAILAPPPRPKPPEPPKAAKPPAAKAPEPPPPAPPEGPWPRIPSARWPKGVLTRPRKTA